MADGAVQAKDPVGGGKKLAGVPVTYWVVGGVVALGGYLYLRSKQASATTSQGGQGSSQAPAAAGPGMGQEGFMLWLLDHSGHPASPRPKKKPAPKPPPKKKRKPDAGGHNKRPPKHKRRPRVKWPKKKHGTVPV